MDENKLLSRKEKEKIIDLFVKYSKVLDIRGKRLPKIKQGIIPDHKIETVGMPKKAKIRPLNPELSKQVKEILLEWKRQGIIRESKGSPYSNAIVVVGKKTEEFASVSIFGL